MQFGADGFLYASGGDGASFNFADYGQDGSPVNPCGDPPGGPGTALTPPTAEGGALRSQDLRTAADPLGLDGTVIRIDPATGAGAPGNPLAANPDANARRVVATGMRNPFRIVFRPGTSDLYVGDVGWSIWEEISRVPTPADGAVDNLGWPCYEGTPRQSGYDNLNLAVCENLYAAGAGAVTAPTLAYRHSDQVATGDGCPTGGSSISGLAFYQGGSYPAEYDGALFFTDYSRRCMWSMRPNAQGIPDPSTVTFFSALPGGAVNLEIGPAGDVFYPDFDNGTIRRIAFPTANQPPTAQVTANPTSGNEPLTVAFSATGSSDPDGDPLTGAWDLDDDGAFDDATGLTASHTFTTTGPKNVRVRVTDPGGLSSTASIVVNVGVAPVATITAPTPTTLWNVGDSIAVSGSATDGGNPLPGSALSWDVDIHHCSAPDVCHVHPVTSFTGLTGSIDAPDHDYPSYITVRLTATDSSGLTDVETVRIDPRTVDLTFQTNPSGLVVSVGGNTQTATFIKEAIVGATYTINTPATQQLGTTSYAFAAWSDGGARSHEITVPAGDTTYTASFTQVASSSLVAAWGFEEGAGGTTADASGHSHQGTISGASWTTAGKYGGALSFDGVNDLVTVADSASLDLTNAYTLEAWVRPTSTGDGWRNVLIKERPSSLAYGLYSGGYPNRPSTWVTINGADVFVEGPAALPANAWTHLATTYDGTTLRLYVNGAQVASRAASGAAPVSGSPFRIGGNTIWSEWFAGQVDDVRVYNRVLTAPEIAADRDTPVAGPEPDTAAPTAPQGLNAVGGAGTATLSWTASTDNLGVAGYRVHRSATSGFTPQPGNQVASTPTTGYTDTVVPGTWHYKVVAYDAAGNVSPPSAQATATVTAETTPPAVAVTAPANGATVSGVVALAADASDASGITSVQFRVDGVDVGAADTTAPYAGSWNTTGLTPGSSHVVRAVATDGAGNTGTSAPVTVTIATPDNTPPTISVTSPTAGAAVSGSVTLTATASDAGGIAHVQFRVDGANVGAADTTSPYSTTWDTSGLAPGSSHVIRAVAQDNAGNTTTSGDVTVTIATVSGPVAAYNFNAGTGTALADRSGTGNNGTISGASWTTAGKYGGALSFDGVNDLVTVADSASLDLTNAYTLEAWVRPTSTGDGWRNVLIKERPSSLAYGLYSGGYPNRPSTWVTINGADVFVEGPAALPANAWTHLATTYDGTTLRLYVNGAQVASRAASGAAPVSGSPFRIGGNTIWSEWFAGQVDDVRVYNRVLTASQIAADRDTPVG